MPRALLKDNNGDGVAEGLVDLTIDTERMHQTPVAKTRLVVGDTSLFVDLLVRDHQHARVLNASGTQIARKLSSAGGLVEFDLSGITLVAGETYTIQNESTGYSTTATCLATGSPDLAWPELESYPGQLEQEFAIRGVRLSGTIQVRIVTDAGIIDCDLVSVAPTKIRAKLPAGVSVSSELTVLRVHDVTDPSDYRVTTVLFK